MDGDSETSEMRLLIATDSSGASETCIVYCYGEVQDMTSCRKAKIDPLGGVIEEKDCREMFTQMTTIEMDVYTNMTSGSRVTLVLVVVVVVSISISLKLLYA